MGRTTFALIAVVLTMPLAGNAQSLAEILSFETDHGGVTPKGWGGGPPGTIFVDDKVVHGGRWAVRIERRADSDGKFSTVTKGLPVDFAGKTLTFRGFLKTEDVSEFVGLWMREDGDAPSLAFDNMQRRQLKGTTDWAEYSITLPVHRDAKQLYFGFLLGGTGKAWVDDLALLVDGKPIWEAPKVERPKTILDTDHEFDNGSGVMVSELTNVQTANLATLGKVWGFLKYHHPRVMSGEVHWDYELFRVLPKILAAGDRAAANVALTTWIDGLGEVKKCESCAKFDEKEVHLRPALDWISDGARLGPELSQRLRAIHANRPSNGKQFYVSLMPGAGNPSFENEPAYQRMKPGDTGFQLVGLYRFWNIIEYWFPYRDVLDDKWDDVLVRFIPRIALAKDSDTYQRELMALIATAHDTHANLWSSLHVRPPMGTCQIAVNVRFVENRAVVWGYPGEEEGKASGLKIGDIITELDGVPVPKLVETWRPYYAASNEPTRLRDIGKSMTRGDCGDAKVRIQRENETVEVTSKRVSFSPEMLRNGNTHDRAGETFQRLGDDVAYLKMSSIKIPEVPRYIDAAAGTKGLIIDIRNYPSDFVVFALGQLLIDRQTEFVRFTNGDLSNPGAFHWTPPLPLTPKTPRYAGKVMILIDEVSQSNAEYTTMAFRASPQAKVVGSTTAGADGNVSAIPLPGGLRSMISGIGVFYPDKKPTQRVGIIPDIAVTPTITGIRAGKDEVLEEALRQIRAQ